MVVMVYVYLVCLIIVQKQTKGNKERDVTTGE
jgi:hypothetical protein